MPQAPSKLQQQFPNGDREAFDVLRSNFTVHKGGIIRPKIKDYIPAEREAAALDYLFLEWDWGYIPEPDPTS